MQIAINKLDESNIRLQRPKGQKSLIPCPGRRERLGQIQFHHGSHKLCSGGDTSVRGTRVDVNDIGRASSYRREAPDQPVTFIAADGDDFDVFQNHSSAGCLVDKAHMPTIRRVRQTMALVAHALTTWSSCSPKLRTRPLSGQEKMSYRGAVPAPPDDVVWGGESRRFFNVRPIQGGLSVRAPSARRGISSHSAFSHLGRLIDPRPSSRAWCASEGNIQIEARSDLCANCLHLGGWARFQGTRHGGVFNQLIAFAICEQKAHTISAETPLQLG